MDAHGILSEMLHQYNVNYSGALDAREEQALRAALTPWIMWMVRPPLRPLGEHQLTKKPNNAVLPEVDTTSYLRQVQLNEQAIRHHVDIPYPDVGLPTCGKGPCNTCESLRMRAVRGEFGDCTYESLRKPWCDAHEFCTVGDERFCKCYAGAGDLARGRQPKE